MKQSKNIKKLAKDHKFYSNKVDELEKERSAQRDFGHKALLVSLKKTKLMIKDQIDRLKK